MKILAFSLSLVALCATGLNAFNSKYYTTPSKKAFITPTSLLNNDEIDSFILGKSFFRIPWVEAPSATTARDGLGPLFNSNTCISCHPNNALGSVYNKNNVSRHMVVRLSIPNSKTNDSYKKMGFTPEAVYGAQLSLNGTRTVPFEGKLTIKYTNKYETYKDGQTVILRKPTYSLYDLNYGPLDKNTIISVRKAPPLVGLGLLELLDDEEILKNEDENDLNNDGISGKANIVYSIIHDDYRLGRYTYKASAPTVKHQSAAAFHNDMGLSTSYFPNDNCTKTQIECLSAVKPRDAIDVPDYRLEAVDFYLRHLKVPKMKITQKEGQQLFTDLACASCHTPKLKTKNNLVISPYSDLLLHDMGEELSDGRSEFKADPREWRTPTLWGIESYSKAIGKRVDFLHDGRAKSIEEAILWHNGEAKNAKEAFKNLDKEKREKLINFIKEL